MPEQGGQPGPHEHTVGRARYAWPQRPPDLGKDTAVNLPAGLAVATGILVLVPWYARSLRARAEAAVVANALE